MTSQDRNIKYCFSWTFIMKHILGKLNEMVKVLMAINDLESKLEREKQLNKVVIIPMLKEGYQVSGDQFDLHLLKADLQIAYQ